MRSSGCHVHYLAAEFCSAAAVELFGGSLQIVVVVMAWLHSSLLEAFDLFTVSSVRVCTIFSHSFSSPVPTMEIRFSLPQRACEMCLLVVGVWGPRGRNCEQADEAERRDDDIKQWRWHHNSRPAHISPTGFNPWVHYAYYLFIFVSKSSSSPLNVSQH